ncbi:MAG: hypothetical protein DDT34_02096 [Firmicutes bacterium]|nr:hypothetical protein [Bacillota bacterium]MBT9165420.1 hypothetical protein [Chloroflexota bacterium]
MIHNPIARAAGIVFGFWWLALTVWGVWNWDSANVTLSTVTTIIAISLAAPLLGAIIGFFGMLAYRSGKVALREFTLRQGASRDGVQVLIGTLPLAPSIERIEPSDADLARIPRWSEFCIAFPLHAQALSAVMAVMKAKESLPASPVPGGHGGRTLIEHSLGVVESMIKVAPKWVYKGQKNKSGKIVRATNEGDHRFTPADFGLLVLTAFSHDIGKVRCYEQCDGRVVEVLPNHDTEGARILRLIPEIMALPITDRRAIITAIAYYHHPFSIPDSDWVTDRVRSLMELLIVADHAAGRLEGHSLTNYSSDEDESAAPFSATYSPDARLEAVMNKVAGQNHKDIFETARAEDEALSSEDTSDIEIERLGKVAAAQHEKLDGDNPEDDENTSIAAFAMALRKSRTEINSKHANTRIGFKRGDYLYLSENRLRALVSMLPESSLRKFRLFSANLVDNNNGEGLRINAYTNSLLEGLEAKGWLTLLAPLSEMNGEIGRVSAKNAIWKITTKISKDQLTSSVGGGFIIISAAPFELSNIKDWPHEIKIEKPFFGLGALLDKAGMEARRSAGTSPSVNFSDESERSKAVRENSADEHGESAKVDEKAIVAQALEDIRLAISDAELEPSKRSDGFMFFKTEGPAGSLIEERLEVMGLSRNQAGILTVMGSSGILFYRVPEAVASPED